MFELKYDVRKETTKNAEKCWNKLGRKKEKQKMKKVTTINNCHCKIQGEVKRESFDDGEWKRERKEEKSLWEIDDNIK